MKIEITEQDKYGALFQQAFDQWGLTANLDMIIEEAAEVIQAINKVKRFNDNRAINNLHEEIADLQICIDLLAATYLSKIGLQDWYRLKIKRMKTRLNGK